MMRRRKDRQGGQGLVEFSLVLPVFLALVFGMIDLGRVVWANDSLGGAAREGARYASVTGDSLITPTATKDQIKAATRNYVFGSATNVSVTVCYYAVDGAPCIGDTDAVGSHNSRGNMVRVGVSGTVPILTGSLIGMGNFSVHAVSAVLINN